MSLQPFFDVVTDCHETEYLTIPKDDKSILPKGTFIFMEYYCANLECDCQGGLVEVSRIDQQGYASNKILAAINFSWKNAPSSQGWEYSLQSDIPKTNVAKLFLEYFKERLETNAEYANSLKRHYDLFKKQIAQPKTFSIPKPKFKKKKIGRNELCFCGSGIKYKKCCMMKKQD